MGFVVFKCNLILVLNCRHLKIYNCQQANNIFSNQQYGIEAVWVENCFIRLPFVAANKFLYIMVVVFCSCKLKGWGIDNKKIIINNLPYK